MRKRQKKWRNGRRKLEAREKEGEGKSGSLCVNRRFLTSLCCTQRQRHEISCYSVSSTLVNCFLMTDIFVFILFLTFSLSVHFCSFTSYLISRSFDLLSFAVSITSLLVVHYCTTLRQYENRIKHKQCYLLFYHALSLITVGWTARLCIYNSSSCANTLCVCTDFNPKDSLNYEL